MFGLSCTQQAIPTPPNLNDLPQGTLDALLDIPGAGVSIEDGEDCEAIGKRYHSNVILTIVVGLNLNVITPAKVRPGSKLPVVVVCTLSLECCHLGD